MKEFQDLDSGTDKKSLNIKPEQLLNPTVYCLPKISQKLVDKFQSNSAENQKMAKTVSFFDKQSAPITCRYV